MNYRLNEISMNRLLLSTVRLLEHPDQLVQGDSELFVYKKLECSTYVTCIVAHSTTFKSGRH